MKYPHVFRTILLGPWEVTVSLNSDLIYASGYEELTQLTPKVKEYLNNPPLPIGGIIIVLD